MNVSKDNNNGVEATVRGDGGATNVLSLRTVTNNSFLSITKYALTSTSIIHSQIPKIPGTRSSLCYLLLIVISVKPRHTVGYYDECLRTKYEVVRKAMRYLIRLGYVREVSSPRLIIPLNTYVVDNCYIVTPLGRSVLDKLINY